MSRGQDLRAAVQTWQIVRRFVWTLWAAYLVFVVYGSLVPLNFQPLDWATAWQRLRSAPYLQLDIQSRADLVANFLLFVPLAGLSLAGLRPKASPAWQALRSAAVVLAGVLLALGIEFTQVFFPGRTVSLNDALAESLGTLAGVALFHAAGPRALHWLAGWWQAERGGSLVRRSLHGYLVGLLLYGVMPLDLTISPVELAHKLNSGGITLLPFSDWPREPAALLYKGLTDLLIWLPVGLLWRLDGRRPLEAAWRGLLAAALIETLQLFVFSRHSSATDLISGCAGVALGAWLTPARWLTAAPVQASRAPGRARWWFAAWLGWLLIALALFWYPFDFDSSGAFVRPRLAALQRPLFATYYMGSEFHALTELLRKVLVMLPGGLLWGLLTQRSGGRALSGVLRLAGALWPAAASLLIEGGQVLLPGKVPDLTDALLEASGAWLGLLLGTRLWSDSGSRAGSGDASAAPTAARRAVAVSPAAPATLEARPRRGWPDLAAVVALTVLLIIVGRRRFVPYNVRELFDPGLAGLVTAGALALLTWWLIALPLSLRERWRRQPERALWLVPGLPLLGLPAALLLVLTVPRESLDDVVGSPILGWPAPLETIGRFAALYAALALAAVGAAWLVARIAGGRRDELLPRWLVVVVLWAWPLHVVVVELAAADNLTELMRDGGGPLASALLFTGVCMLFVWAFAAAALLACGGRRLRLALTAALAWPAAAACLWAGSETGLFKYGQLFSAAQFLLSTDRQHYAAPALLWWRWGLVTLALAGVSSLLQTSHWRRLAARQRPQGAPDARRPR